MDVIEAADVIPYDPRTIHWCRRAVVSSGEEEEMRNSAPMFIVVVLGLLIGWTAGRAQTSAPDFEL